MGEPGVLDLLLDPQVVGYLLIATVVVWVFLRRPVGQLLAGRRAARHRRLVVDAAPDVFNPRPPRLDAARQPRAARAHLRPVLAYQSRVEPRDHATTSSLADDLRSRLTA